MEWITVQAASDLMGVPCVTTESLIKAGELQTKSTLRGVLVDAQSIRRKKWNATEVSRCADYGNINRILVRTGTRSLH